MPLKQIRINHKVPGLDLSPLRSIKTLERINDKPAAEFWKEMDAKAASIPSMPSRFMGSEV